MSQNRSQKLYRICTQNLNCPCIELHPRRISQYSKEVAGFATLDEVEEVSLDTLNWIREARSRSEEVTFRTIQRKATEIAGGMGKKFLPHTSWAVRLCRRGGISLKKG